MTLPLVLHAESFSWTNAIYPYPNLYSHAFHPLHFISGIGRGIPLHGDGGNGAMSHAGLGTDGLGWDVPSPNATMGNCFAVTQGVDSNNNINYGNVQMLQLWTTNPDPTSAGYTGLLLQVGTNSSGHVQLRGPAVGTPNSDTVWSTASVLATSSTVIPPGAQATPYRYTHLEVVATINSSGSVTIYCEGTSCLTYSGNTGTGTIGHIRVMSTGQSAICDWVVHDGSAQLGDVRVAYCEANANGTYSAGTAVGAGTLHEAVDEYGADIDAAYISQDDTSLPKSVSLNTTNLPSNVTSVVAVIPHVVVRKDDAGINKGRLFFKSGATEQDGGADLTLATAWDVYRRVYNTDPNTSAAWTITNANLVEVGWKRTT